MESGEWRFLKLPLRIFLKMSSVVWDKLFDEVFGLVANLTGNFFSIIFFRTFVLRSFCFFKIMILFLGSIWYFLIVRKTFLST